MLLSLSLNLYQYSETFKDFNCNFLGSICHLGKTITNGHYICNIYKGCDKWLIYNNENVKEINVKFPNRIGNDVYLLFYIID